jgi:hypothetical protein
MLYSIVGYLVAIAVVSVAYNHYSRDQACTVDPVVSVPWILDGATVQQQRSRVHVSSCDVFSDTYGMARNRFRAAAEAARVRVTPLTVHQDGTNDEYTMGHTASKATPEAPFKWRF